MDKKNYVEVLIDGKIYTLCGEEDQEYLQKVAAYLNQKITTLKAQPGFKRQSLDYQELMIQLNITDDYFKTLDDALKYRTQKEELEREIYSLKHELISVQMELDALSGKSGK